MFSQVSVHRGAVMGFSKEVVCSGGVSMSGGENTPPPTWDIRSTHSTPSPNMGYNGIWSASRRAAGGMYPSGMLSCYIVV